MAYLTINGVDFVDVLAGADARGLDRIAGGLERTDNGTARAPGGPAYWTHRFATRPLTASMSRAVRGLLEGEGHVLSFESTTTSTSFLWTSRGAVPSSSSGAIYRDTSTFAKGLSCATSNSTGTATWALGLGSAWTVLYFFRVGNDAWAHVVSRSDGTHYVNGVLSAAPTSGLSVSSGSLVLSASSGVFRRWDDIVALPYLVPTSWVSQLYAFHTANAWPWPHSLASGDRVESAPMKVRGELMGDEESVGFVDSGLWVSNGGRFDFKLMQTP